MKYNDQGEAEDADPDNENCDDVPEYYDSVGQSNNENEITDSESARRILNQTALRGLSENPEHKSGKFITLKKLPDDRGNVKIRPFDDGLYFKFDKIIKPKHVSFYCKTDDEASEACNFRMFQLDNDNTEWEDNDYGWEQKEIRRTQTPIFFRFGFH